MLICFIISCLVLLHVISTGLWDPQSEAAVVQLCRLRFGEEIEVGVCVCFLQVLFWVRHQPHDLAHIHIRCCGCC